MRIFHGNRPTEWLLAVTVLLWFGGAAFAMPRVPRTGQDGHSKATVKPASTRSAKKTSAKLSAKKSSAKRTRTQMAPTSARISEIQSALATQGSYEGATTGKWDDATVSAMRRFQSAHGLNPSGKLDALTLQKLGLGSNVAGRGAPLPSANPQASAIGEAAHELP
jgi:peptidoglycan hydrolase-like protein with peptidoglycan-binding domain